MKRHLLSLAVLTTFFLLNTQTVDAQNWIRFRGPNGQGAIEAKFPGEWTEKNVAFKIELPGEGHSAPAIWGNKLFILSADRTTAERFMLGIDATTGKTLWKRSYDSEEHRLHIRSSYASCSPAVDADHVYIAFSDPEHTWLKAFSHDGREVWSVDMGTWRSMHGFGTSPMLYKDMVILNNAQQGSRLEEGEKPPQSYVYAFDRATGDLRWKSPLQSASCSYSVPCIYTDADGNDQLICTNTLDGMYSLNPMTGERNWNIVAFDKRTVSSPVIAGGHLFGSTGSGGGGNYVAAVKPTKDPSITFKVDRAAPYVPTSVAAGDLLFLWYDKGILTCIDARDGKVHYQERLDTAFSGSPIRIGDKVFCIDEDGIVHCVAATKEYKLISKFDLGAPSRSTPAFANGKLYLRTYSHLYCISPEAL